MIGATASVRLYSLVETVRANSIEPHAYFSRLFTELPKATSADHFEALLPWNITIANSAIITSSQLLTAG